MQLVKIAFKYVTIDFTKICARTLHGQQITCKVKMLFKQIHY